MQRPVVVSARTNEDHVIIDVHPHSPYTDPRRRADQETDGGSDDLAAMEAGYNGDSSSNNRRGRRRGGKSRFRMTAGNWIHVIPTIVFICFFILWWRSYPVEIRDGRVIRIHRLHKLPQPFDEDHIDFTFLSVATSPSYAASSFSQESLDNTSSIISSVNNETRADLTFLATTTAAPSPYEPLLQERSDNAASAEAYSPLGG